MKRLIAVRCTLGPSARTSRLGIVDAMREAVASVRRRHPHLTTASVADVSIKRVDGEIQVTLYFSLTKSQRVGSIANLA